MPTAKPKEKSSKFWCFTINLTKCEDWLPPLEISDHINHKTATKDIRSLWNTDKCSLLVYQTELGVENNYYHIQGFIILKRSLLSSFLRKHLPRAHVEFMISTPEECIKYCTKEDTRVLPHILFGEHLKSKQGKRSDLDAVYDLIKEGETLDQIVDFYPKLRRTVFQYHKSFQHQQELYTRTLKRIKPTVIVIYGPPGSGKSLITRTIFPKVYNYPGTSNNIWFDMYDRHKVILFDDFRDSLFPLSKFLQLLDRYPMMVPVKGSFVNFVPEYIVLTTNIDPQLWYHTHFNNTYEVDNSNIMRRIDHIINLPNKDDIQTIRKLILTDTDYSSATASDCLRYNFTNKLLNSLNDKNLDKTLDKTF